MHIKATELEKEMAQKRSRLLEYSNNNKEKDTLSREIYGIMTEPSKATRQAKVKKASSKIKKHNFTIEGAHELGLCNNDIHDLISSFPGVWLSSFSYSNNHPPAHKTQSTGRQSVVLVENDNNNLAQVSIFNPITNSGLNSDVLCHGCIQAHTTAHYPNKISQKSVDSISKSINSIDSGVFHSTHKDNINKPGRSHLHAKQESEAVLWPSFIQTAFEAPLLNNDQDWRLATFNALMGMQYLTASDAEKIIDSLSLYFSELDPEADMNQLIRNYQKQVNLLEFKILSKHISVLFQEMPDKGLKNFFNRWIKHLNQESTSLPALQARVRQHVPSLRVGMALDDAKELGANLSVSLRVQATDIKDKRRVLNDLRSSIRRFNDIWRDLDKKEQKFLRPKLLQIVHSSIY